MASVPHAQPAAPAARRGFILPLARPGAGLLAGVLLVAALAAASMAYGAMAIPLSEVIGAYTRFDGTDAHLVVTTVRMPRTLLAVAVGASLGIAGLLLQMLTRNPLADVEVAGINAGAATAVVLLAVLGGPVSLGMLTATSLAGAAAGGLLVYALAALGRDGPTPLKLTLAGAAVWALGESLTSGLLTAHERALDEVLFWLKGSVAGRELPLFAPLLPWMALGWLVALAVAPALHTLTLGDDVARGLGVPAGAVRLAAGAAVVVLAGTSVAAAGPIGFVGLVAAHLARATVGLNPRWMVAYSTWIGSATLLAADLAGRFLAMPEELPVGVATALLGAPFFIMLGRRALR